MRFEYFALTFGFRRKGTQRSLTYFLIKVHFVGIFRQHYQILPQRPLFAYGADFLSAVLSAETSFPDTPGKKP